MMRMILWLAAFLAAVPAAAQPIVDAPAGRVRGESGEGVSIYRGIPYAQPPVGERRWRAPAPLPRWEGVRDGTRFGAACVQPPSRPGSIYHDDVGRMSEDCLSLNVWAPANARGKLPVFVWIHGGSLLTGSGGLGMYDGSALARKGMIVVTINYRLGALGYLAHPSLSAESPDRISGNYGLLDQVEALKWVKQNIGAFGGDPDQVTIAGESAGALSVTYLLASPRAHGLFHRAIAQSAYLVTMPALREPVHGMPGAEAAGVQVQTQLGASDLAALRAMDAHDITNRVPRTGWIPWGVVDGAVLRRQLVDTFDRGEQAPVPLLAGFNSGEIRTLRFLLPPIPGSAEAYETAIRRGYDDLADQFLRLYPSRNIEEAMLATTRDAMYGWTAQRLAATQRHVGKPGYFYIFDHGYPAADRAGLHAFHAAEIPYVFGNERRTANAWPAIPDNPAERRFGQAMLDYWSSFAKTGVPSAPGQPAWPAFARNNGYMFFAQQPSAANNLLRAEFALHEAVMCRRKAAGTIAWNWNVGIAAPPLPPPSPGCR